MQAIGVSWYVVVGACVQVVSKSIHAHLGMASMPISHTGDECPYSVGCLSP